MMHKFIPGAALLGLAVATAAEPATDAQPEAKPVASSPAAEPAPKVTDPAVIKTDSSYALGYRAGGSFSQQYGRFGISHQDIDFDKFLAGFEAAVKSEEPELDNEKLQGAMQALGDLLQEREKQLAEANLEAGKKFLEQNGKREGVTTTESGLQYEVLTKGGEEKYVAPAEGDQTQHQFMVNYRGTLIDGTEFDASPEGQPVPMTLQVVPGFKEALTTMPVGAKWKVFLPSDLAYGKQRRSEQIGPNSTLIFELELIDINESKPARAVSPPVQVPPMPEQ